MALLDKMPGVGMPVSEVPRALRELWKTDEGESPTKFRAVQSNLILHFGLEATESEAKVVLDRALDFARRYPSRLICLCPFRDVDEQLMRGKLFSQCYLAGGSKHPVCCEALMLGYTPDDAEFLEHQIELQLLVKHDLFNKPMSFTTLGFEFEFSQMKKGSVKKK